MFHVTEWGVMSGVFERTPVMAALCPQEPALPQRDTVYEQIQYIALLLYD